MTPSAYLVNVLGDTSGSVGGSGSGTVGDLRFCLNQAIQDQQADTITFDSTVFTGSVQQTITLAGTLITKPSAFTNPYGQTSFIVGASDNVTIDGSLGANGPGITLDGGGLTRLFAVAGGGTLQLSNLTLTGGKATGGAGGIDNVGGAGGGGAGLGGAVLVDGNTSSFTASGCTFLNNQATGGAGGTTTTGGNQAGAGGGGLGAPGSAPVGSTGGAGGGVNGGSGGARLNSGRAGGLGGGGGGGGDGANGTAIGRPGGVGGFGGGGGGGGNFSHGGSGGFGGGGGGGGGGKGSSLGAGGGFGGGGGGTGVSNGNGGGGGGGAGLGGAIFSNGGSLTLTNDTFTQNTATGGAGGTGGNAGAAGRGQGGAVFVRNGTLNATFVTLSANTAAQGGTDVYVLSDGSGNRATATLRNSILGQNANTTVTNFFATTNGGGMAANLAASTNNLVTLNGSGANGLPAGARVTGTNPNFDAAGLADNGGPTRTIALTAQSTAALVSGAAGTGITTDQRGRARTSNPDLGAFQFTAAGPTIGAISPSQGPSTGGTSIIITGTGFVSGATVTVGGPAATSVIVVSATSITATTPAGTVGAADVVVTNTDTSTVTASGGFTYLQTLADLSIAASGPGTAVAGAAAGFDYVLTVTNAGPSDNVGGFTLIDVLPAGLTFQSAGSTPGASAVGQTVTYTTAAGLASGATASVTLHVTLATDAADDSTLSNTATVATAGTTDPTAGNDTSNTVATSVQTLADLSIAASGSGTATAGAAAGFDYVLTVTNAGPSDNVGGFTLIDVLPAGLTFQSAGSTPGASAVGQTVTYTTAAGLASGATASVTLHVTLAANAAAGAIVSNTATVTTAGTVDPSAGNDTSNTVATSVQTLADLSIAASGSGTATAGAAAGFDYVLTVTNAGPSDNVGGFTLTDVLPAGLTFQATGSTPGTSAVGQTVTYTSVSGLASGATAIVTLHVTLATDAADDSTLSNTATVATAGTTDPTAGNDTSNTVATSVQTLADLSIAASGSGTATAGAAAGFDYVLTVTNAGPSDNVGGFTLTDVLPAGLTFQSAGSTPGASAVGQTVTYTSASGLASGASATVTVHVTLAAATVAGTTLSNTATVATASTADPSAGNDTSNTVATTVQSSADLSIAQSGPATATAGTAAGFDYVLTVTNAGPSDNAGGFTLTDVLPAGLTFQSAGSTPGASAVGQTVTYTTASGLASGATATVTLHVTLAASAAEGMTLSNTATVATASTADPSAGNDTSNTVATTVQSSADLSIAQSGPATATATAGTAGGFDYVLTVTNAGPSDNAGGFTLTDVLPAGLTFQSAGSTPGASAVGQTVTYTSASGLASGASATVTVHVTLAAATVAGTTLSNTATVATAGTASANDTSNTVATTVQTSADLSIAQSGPGTTVAGAAAGFDYVFTVTNAGPSDTVGGFTLTDVLPPGLTFQAAGSTPGASAAGQIVTYTSASGLASGAYATVTLHVTLAANAAAGTTLSNTATVATTGTADPSAGNDTSNSVATSVQREVDLQVEVTDTPDPVTAGSGAGNLVYTVTVHNSGPSDASGVQLSNSNTLPTGVVLSSTGLSQGSFEGSTSTWNVGSLAAGASATLTVTFTVDSSTAEGTDVISVTASVSSVAGNELLVHTTDDSAGASTSVEHTTAHVTGVLFIDYNADDRQDPGEAGVVGRTVFLDQDGNGVLDDGEPSTVTGPGGAYSITGIAPGTYTLRLQTLGFETGVGADGAGTTLVVSSNDTIAGIDLGERVRSAVGPLPVDSQVFAGTFADADTALIQGYYHAILGRAGESAGVSNWISLLHTTSPQTVIQGFLNSDEFRTRQVQDYYRVLLGRVGSGSEVSSWVREMLLGMSSSQVATAFLTSPEFARKTVSNQAFIESLYRLLLSREGDADGAAGWTHALNTRAMTRSSVIAAFFNSTESQNRALDSMYAQLLERPIDPIGRAHFQTRASTGTGNDQLIVTLLSSQEFLSRRHPWFFGQVARGESE